MAEKNKNTPESMLHSFEEVSLPTNNSITQGGVQRVVDVEKSSEDDNKKNEAIEEPEIDTRTDGFNKDDEDTFKSLNEQLEKDPEKSQAGCEVDPEKLRTEDIECEEQPVSPDKLELVRPYIIDSKDAKKSEPKKKETGVNRIREVPNIRMTDHGGDDGRHGQFQPVQYKVNEEKSTPIWIISGAVGVLLLVFIYLMSPQSPDPEIEKLQNLVKIFTEENNELKSYNEKLVNTNIDLKKDLENLKTVNKGLEVKITDLKGEITIKIRQVTQLESVKQDSQTRLNNAEAENQKCQLQLNNAEAENQKCQLRLNNAEAENQKCQLRLNNAEAENQKCQLRLSANFEAEVRDDNDKITKVTDDSPIKIAEQFKETYDNEYTYAFEEMEEMGLNSGIETSTKRMLDILEDANDLCRHYSFGHLKSIRESITNIHVEAPINHEKEKYSQGDDFYGGGMKGVTHMVKVSSADKLTTLEYSQILEMRKIAAYKMEDQLMKVLADVIVSKYGIERETRPAMMKYIDKCLELCWMMTMNKPPVYIKFIKPSETELFDNTIFRPFLHSGVHLNYIVWPPVYLHEAGGLISKGIAEGKP